MQKIVGEVFFDYIAFVAAADDEIVDAVRRINLHYVPKHGTAPDLNHGLRAEMGFF